MSMTWTASSAVLAANLAKARAALRKWMMERAEALTEADDGEDE